MDYVGWIIAIVAIGVSIWLGLRKRQVDTENKQLAEQNQQLLDNRKWINNKGLWIQNLYGDMPDKFKSVIDDVVNASGNSATDGFRHQGPTDENK
jgi:hypothetical protein